MLKIKIVSGSFAVAVLAGCASTPQNAGRVDELRSEYETLAARQDVREYAPIALKKAEESLTTAEKMVDRGVDEDVLAHQMYLVDRKIDTASSTARMAKADEQIANAELKRKDTLLEARREDLRDAKAEAERLRERAHRAEKYASAMEDKAEELSNRVDNLKAENTDRGLVLTIGSILFELNQAELKPGAERTLEQVAEFLNDYPNRKIMVEGFTDSTGEESYNQDLSERRARTVTDALVANGVDMGRLEARGYGESYPIASNDNRAGRQLNRRVELIVANTDGEAITTR